MKNNFTIFINRLKKIGIDIEVSSNVPWIYLEKINGKKVTEKHNSEYGFIIGYLSMKSNDVIFINYKIIFDVIRKYVKLRENKLKRILNVTR